MLEIPVPSYFGQPSTLLLLGYFCARPPAHRNRCLRLLAARDFGAADIPQTPQWGAVRCLAGTCLKT